jgi:hypothetical protein
MGRHSLTRVSPSLEWLRRPCQKTLVLLDQYVRKAGRLCARLLFDDGDAVDQLASDAGYSSKLFATEQLTRDIELCRTAR